VFSHESTGGARELEEQRGQLLNLLSLKLKFEIDDILIKYLLGLNLTLKTINNDRMLIFDYFWSYFFRKFGKQADLSRPKIPVKIIFFDIAQNVNSGTHEIFSTLERIWLIEMSRGL